MSPERCLDLLQTILSISPTGAESNLASSSVPSLTPQSVAPNVNIANIPGLATNINIQNLANLQGVNIANLQGLQNMQVSLTGVSVPGGGIAVPVPINMINTSPSLLQNQGIIVSSLPNQTSGAGGAAGSSSGGSSSTTSSQVSRQNLVQCSGHRRKLPNLKKKICFNSLRILKSFI